MRHIERSFYCKLPLWRIESWSALILLRMHVVSIERMAHWFGVNILLGLSKLFIEMRSNHRAAEACWLICHSAFARSHQVVTVVRIRVRLVFCGHIELQLAKDFWVGRVTFERLVQVFTRLRNALRAAAESSILSYFKSKSSLAILAISRSIVHVSPYSSFFFNERLPAESWAFYAWVDG